MFGEWQSSSVTRERSVRDRLNTWTVRIRTRELRIRTRERRTPLGKESLHCKTYLCKGIVKSYRTLALHGLAPFPRTSNRKRHKRFDFHSVQTLRTKLAESVVAPQPRIRQGISRMPATHDESMRTVCHTMDRCEPCGALGVAPCLQGGPRLVAHRLRWGPRVDTYWVHDGSMRTVCHKKHWCMPAPVCR